MTDLDIVLKDGYVVDGTGAPWFKKDIGIKKGKIKKIGRIKKGEETIDASGMIVSPGFIDLHNHSDLTILAYPDAESNIMQGITTAVVGNCGISMAPVNRDTLDLLKRYLSPFLVPNFDYEWDWETLKEYYEKIEEKGTTMNLVPLVGHGTLRIAVEGFEKTKPSREEMDEMKRLLAQSLENGAFGMSTGLEYPPGSYAETEELIELGRVLKQYGRIYTSHVRNEGDALMEAVEEAIRIGEKSGIPVQISHHKACGKGNYGKVKVTLRAMKKARERSVEVDTDVYPYNAASTTITILLPTWSVEGGIRKMLERLENKETREKIRAEIAEDRMDKMNEVKAAGFDGVVIASCPSNQEYEGKSLEEILKKTGRFDEPYEGLLDFLLEIKGDASVILFEMSEEDVKTIMRDPLSSFITDSWATAYKGGGKPHPRAYGTYPRILRKYVRDEKILTLENAIRKMSSLPAAKVRLEDRGLIKKGFWADIVVFNLAKITDKATYANPHQYPEGIEDITVNGEIVVQEGKLTGKRPGKVIKFT